MSERSPAGAGDEQLRPIFCEQGMSFIEFVQDVIPGLDEAEADHALWERTPFPMVRGRDDLLPHLITERQRRTGVRARRVAE